MAAVVPAHVTLLYPEEAVIRLPGAPTPFPDLRHEKRVTEHLPTQTQERTLDPCHVEDAVAEERLLAPCHVEEVLAETMPFRLRLGAVIALEEGRGGVFVAVQDVDGGWAHLRRRLLGPARGTAAGLTSGFPPHATIVHPRTSRRGPECWQAYRGRSLNGEFTISEIAHTTTTAEAFSVEQRFPLRRPPHGPGPPHGREPPRGQ